MKWTDIPGRLTADEGEFLRELAAGTAVLEIGSLFGRSTVCMAQIAEHVHAVDPHRPGNCDWCEEFSGRDTLAELRQNIAAAGLAKRVSLHVCTVAELWLPSMPLFGFAFIDGSHSRAAVLADLAFAWQAVYGGGVIALHDRDRPGVAEAIAEFGRPVVRQAGSIAVLEVQS